MFHAAISIAALMFHAVERLNLSTLETELGNTLLTVYKSMCYAKVIKKSGVVYPKSLEVFVYFHNFATVNPWKRSNHQNICDPQC